VKDSERLATIGATAGMVGHDIRNPLQAIMSDVFLAKQDLNAVPEGEEKKNLQESLQGIEENVSYINKIVSDLQDYAKPIKPIPKEANLKSLCQDVVFKSKIPKNIKVSCRVDDDAKVAMVDFDLLRRAVNNLVTNAVQAMPKGGKLSVHTYQQEGDIVIDVMDSGEGIPEEIKPKLFTPLFTTKSKGQGFGLAVVKRVVESMNGTITFESKEGNGTKFIIRVPAAISKNSEKPQE